MSTHRHQKPLIRMDTESIKTEPLCEKDYNNFLIGTKENKDKETVPGTPLNHPHLTGIRPKCH